MAFQGMTDTNETRPQFIPDNPSTQRRVAEQTYDGSITKGPEDERLSGALRFVLSRWHLEGVKMGRRAAAKAVKRPSGARTEHDAPDGARA